CARTSSDFSAQPQKKAIKYLQLTESRAIQVPPANAGGLPRVCVCVCLCVDVCVCVCVVMLLSSSGFSRSKGICQSAVVLLMDNRNSIIRLFLCVCVCVCVCVCARAVF